MEKATLTGKIMTLIALTLILIFLSNPNLCNAPENAAVLESSDTETLSYNR